LLEDLVKGATNQALDRSRKLVGEETGRTAASFGLAGMPNLGEMTDP